MTLIEKKKKAKELEEKKQWDDAIIIYKEILQEEKTVENIERLGWCYSREQNYKNALKCFNYLEQNEPKMAKWKYMIGYQYYCMKEWTNAINYFEKALKIKHDYLIVKYRVSYAYYQLAGNYKELTKAEYWKALGHLDECDEIWKNYNEIEKRKMKSTYYEICFLHGKMLQRIPNQRKKAIKYFKNALQIKKDETCKYNLSKTYYLEKEYELAKENLPNSRQYYVLELEAYIETRLENYDKAIELMQQLMKRNKKKDYFNNNLAFIYLIKGDNEKALKYANNALRINSKNHKVHYTLAIIYYKYGLLDSALNELELAIDFMKKIYHADYREAILLKERIISEKPQEYKENTETLKKLNSLKFQNENEEYKYGIIKEYNVNKKYGFILCNNKKIFFHITDYKGKGLRMGMKVKFMLKKQKNGKNKAIDIVNVKK